MKRLQAGDKISHEDVSVAVETKLGGQGGKMELLKVTTAGWRIEAGSRLIWRSTSPGKKQIDLSFAPLRDPLAPQPATRRSVAPHGLIGQSYDGDKVAVDGKQDHYKDLWKAQGGGHEIVTQAQAEGAIEGSGEEYKMTGFFETKYKYSRFSVLEAPVRDVAKLAGTKREATRVGGDGTWNFAAGTIGDDEREGQNDPPVQAA